jgi:hypothetical protein
MCERSQYRTILITDIENYSAQYRTDAIRARLRAQLRRLMTATLSDTGMDDTHYTMYTTGDGWLVTIDPAVGKPRILGPVVDRLGAGLRKQNRQVDMLERLRVRLVLHAGDVLVDQDGHFGDQLNFAFWLLEAQELRELLRQASGPLLVCVSDAVYQQVIAQRHEGLDPAAFEAVWLKCKDIPRLGWVHVPGESGLASRTGLLALDV